MSPPFDPYLIWLGIRDPQRPPNHYRLLGLELFEPDPEVIRHAAQMRSHYVRRFLAGEHAREARQLLEELATAGKCLLEPKLRASYDSRLRRETGQRSPARPAAVTEVPDAVPPLPEEPPQATPSFLDRLAGWWRSVIGGAFGHGTGREGVGGTIFQSNIVLRWAVAGLLVLVVLLAGLTIAVSRRASRTEAVGPTVAQGPGVEGTTSPAGATSAAQPEQGSAATAPDSDLHATPPESSSAGSAQPPGTPSTGRGGTGQPGGAGASSATTSATRPQVSPAPAKASKQPSAPGKQGTAAQGSAKTVPATTPSAPAENAGQQPTEGEEPPASAPTGATEGAASSAEQSPAGMPPGETQPAATEPAPGPAAEEPAQPVRLPVPDKAAADAALADLRARIQAQLQAATDPARKTALAQNLLKRAETAGQEPAASYVMLREAIRLALEGGAGKVVHEAVTQLAGRYDVDAWAEMVAVFSSAVEAPYPPPVKADLAMQALWEAEDAVDNERFDAAEQLARAANLLGLKAKESTVAKQAGNFLSQLSEWRKQYALSVKAAEVLAQNPDLPQANLALGKYLCFFRRTPQWEKGLPYLAKGDDPTLKALAEAEAQLATAEKVTASQWVALADRWYQASRSADTSLRAGMAARAAWWYRKALPQLRGFTKVRVEKALTEIGSANR